MVILIRKVIQYLQTFFPSGLYWHLCLSESLHKGIGHFIARLQGNMLCLLRTLPDGNRLRCLLTIGLLLTA